MKLRRHIFVLLLSFVAFVPMRGQQFAIHNNLLFDAAGALSAGVELPLSGKASLEAYGSLRPWKRGEQSVHKHWALEAQYRIWPCQVMNGFYFGPYLHGGEFNIGNHDLVFGLLDGLKPRRYEGWFIGGGLGAGYEYPVARHWNIGAEIGLGYTYIDYKKYNCEVCGALKADDVYHYIGVSKLGLNIIYVF